ncbi:MAG TPA: HEAT repeat domain-containing protein [Gemmatimonadales bacterium]
MLSPQSFATHFARAVDLFRDAGAKDAQKVELRALMGMLSLGAVTLRADERGLFVNDESVDGVMFGTLRDRLGLHGVREITIPADAPAADVFNLLKSLADQPGMEDIPSRLRSTGAQRVTVAIAQLFEAEPAPAAPPPPPVPEFILEQPPEPAPTPKLDLGTDGILHGELGDVSSPADPVSVGPISREVPPPPPPEPPPPPPPSPAPPPPAPRAATSSGKPSPVDEGLAQLLRSPNSPAVGDILSVLGGHVETAVRSARWEHALKILSGIIRAEQQVPDTQKRQYSIALKRMYSKPLLDGLLQMLELPAHEADAVLVLQRAGADGVEVLLDLLVASPTASERRGVFNALAKMKEGGEQLIHMLGHPQWFVVRNVAELVGEMGVEEAVPALAKQLDHADERVRKAIALALAKIGSRGAAEPLRRALRDKAQAVRLQAALGVGGKRASALAMPLVVAMEEEKDPEVERELILALGRIGSPDAVQALIKMAQPSGKILGRKPTAYRIAAVEALRLAATPAALGTLQGLSGDSDRQVRAAAQAAVTELKR